MFDIATDAEKNLSFAKSANFVSEYVIRVQRHAANRRGEEFTIFEKFLRFFTLQKIFLKALSFLKQMCYNVLCIIVRYLLSLLYFTLGDN